FDPDALVAVELPEHLGDRAVRGRAVLVPVPFQRADAEVLQDGPDQQGLAHTRLAGEEQQGRAGGREPAQEPRELRPLTLPIDEVTVHPAGAYSADAGAQGPLRRRSSPPVLSRRRRSSLPRR